jgi:hypothetical protein
MATVAPWGAIVGEAVVGAGRSPVDVLGRGRWPTQSLAPADRGKIDAVARGLATLQ